MNRKYFEELKCKKDVRLEKTVRKRIFSVLKTRSTVFWRAPEILEQLKVRVPSSNMNFTMKGDVYSFGIPFEGHPPRDYDLVLSGNRPEWPPEYIDPVIKDLIASCWHVDPLQRLNFQDISFKVAEAYGSLCGMNYQVAKARLSGY